MHGGVYCLQNSAEHLFVCAVEGVTRKQTIQRLFSHSKKGKQLICYPQKSFWFSPTIQRYSIYSGTEMMQCVWKIVKLFHSFLTGQYTSSERSIHTALFFLTPHLACCLCEHAKIDLFYVRCQPYSPGSFEELQLDMCPEYGPLFHGTLKQCRENTHIKAGPSVTVSTQASSSKNNILCQIQSKAQWLKLSTNIKLQ